MPSSLTHLGSLSGCHQTWLVVYPSKFDCRYMHVPSLCHKHGLLLHPEATPTSIIRSWMCMAYNYARVVCHQKSTLVSVHVSKQTERLCVPGAYERGFAAHKLLCVHIEADDSLRVVLPFISTEHDWPNPAL